MHDNIIHKYCIVYNVWLKYKMQFAEFIFAKYTNAIDLRKIPLAKLSRCTVGLQQIEVLNYRTIYGSKAYTPHGSELAQSLLHLSYSNRL